MKKISNHFIKLLILIGIWIGLSCFGALLNLLGVTSSFLSIIFFVGELILFFIIGRFYGHHTKRKGLTIGLLAGVLLSIIMFLLSCLLFRYPFKWSNLIFYLILTLTATLGGIHGKNRK